MKHDDVLKLHAEWQRAIFDQLQPLLADPGKKGLAVMRVFYVMVPEDGGEPSAGQIGLTPQGSEKMAIRLARALHAILTDKEQNHRVEAVEVTGKS